MLESDAPLTLANLWLKRERWLDGLPTIRKYKTAWYGFTGRCYEPLDEEADVRGKIYDFFDDKMVKRFTSKGDVAIEPYKPNSAKVSNIVDAMSSPCPVKGDIPCWLDGRSDPAPDNLVTFRNGTLDVAKYSIGGEVVVVPPTPQLFSLAALPYDFEPAAVCPKWLRYLGQVFPDDKCKADLLQEWYGYNMVMDTSLEKFMLLVGRSGSGKGTALTVLQTLLGKQQYVSTSFKMLSGDFGLHPLIGKLAAIMSDAHVSQKIDSVQALEMLKQLTGEDDVSVNRKNKDIIGQHKLTTRITIATNSLPNLPDHEDTLRRRLLLIHFNESFAGREDTGLKRALCDEAPGIAVWALAGLKRLRANGVFTVPPSSGAVVADLRRIMAPVAEFLHECCEITPGGKAWTAKDTLFDAWYNWSKRHSVRTDTHLRFCQRVTAQFPDLKSQYRALQNRPRVAGYLGLVILPEAQQRYLEKPG